jgi:ADP-heptose:LPS heptosyltransferase
MPDSFQAARSIDVFLAQSRLDRVDALIVIHVIASTRFKRWPEDSFVSLVTRLVRQGTHRKVFFTSGPSDAEAAQRIADATRKALGPLATAILESRQLTLPELRALVMRAALFVGGDSGPVHIAATTSVPIVELLGPTLPERSFPWRDPSFYSEIIDPGELPCRPCHQRTCVPGDFRCLTSIGPDRVLAAAERALRSTTRIGKDAAPAPNERRIPVVH